MNPLPVLEMDLDGRITYYNQAALKALGKEGQAEDLKKFLPDDIQEILATAKQTGERNFQREVAVNGAVFLENIYFAEELKAVRLYAVDVTELHGPKRRCGRAKNIIVLCSTTCSTALLIARCILSTIGRWISPTLKLMTPSKT